MNSIYLRADKSVSADIFNEHIFMTDDEHYETLDQLISSYYNQQNLENDIIKRQKNHKKNLDLLRVKNLVSEETQKVTKIDGG